MAINQLLLRELEAELKKTRVALERVPAGKADFTPHPKSMPMGKLAAHIAQLGGFGMPILNAPGLDFATAGMKPQPPAASAELVQLFEHGVAQVRSALAQVPDPAWSEPWKLHHGETVFFQGTRFEAYRAMYLNHIVHHRAQLGVYLRQAGVAVPSTYGPSADEAA
ncbi:MAG: DinB family protein [Terriglobales bacterium]